LAERPPDYLVLGNSLAGDVLVDQLTADLPALGQGTVLSLGGSPPSVWYLLLKNRVYAGGHEPKLLIVPTTLQALTLVSEQRDLALEHIAAQRSPYEPVIDAKMAGALLWPEPVERALSRRVVFREALLDGARDLAAGLFFRDAGTPVLEGGREVAIATLSRLFTDDASDGSLSGRVIPVVQQETKPRVAAVRHRVADTFLPDLLAIAAEHGTRVVVVRVPVTTWTPNSKPMDPEVAEEILQTLRDAHAGYIDLSRGILTDADFVDDAHPGRPGKQKLTKALAPQLEAIGALGDGPLTPPRTPLRAAAVERTGTPATPEFSGLAAMDGSPCGWRVQGPNELASSPQRWRGLARLNPTPLVLKVGGVPLTRAREFRDIRGDCAGSYLPNGAGILFTPPPGVDPQQAGVSVEWDSSPTVVGPDGKSSLWLLPGTELTMRVDTPWDEAAQGAFAVVVSGVSLGAKGAPPTLLVGSERAAMRRVGADVFGALRAGTPVGPWAIQFSNPVDGSPVMLRSIGVWTANPIEVLYGDEGTKRVATVVLTEAPRPKEDIRYAAPPPPLHTTFSLDGTTGVLAVKELGGPLAPRCVPVELYRDGERLDLRAANCAELAPGAVCLSPKGELRFQLDGPLSTTSLWTARLRADRRCNDERISRLFLYPGDAVTLGTAIDEGAEAVYDTLVLYSGWSGKGAVPSVHITLRADDKVVLERTVAMATVNGTSLEVRLPRPLTPKAQSLSLTLATNAADKPLLIRSASLRGVSGWGQALRLLNGDTAEAAPNDAPVAPKPPFVVGMPKPSISLDELRSDAGETSYRYTAAPSTKWSFACTPKRAVSGPVVMQGRFKIEQVTRSKPGAWAGASAAYRWWDASGATGVVPLGVWTKPQDWAPLPSGAGLLPKGTVEAMACVRFIGASGVMEIANLSLADVEAK